ncbi:MAG: c-type cytochrome biogenesis protein CcmI [Gammaproteobacteria bacterium]|nr:c-type cytochrome biogenesis protein CcmI [Gammaproteobacteria bacterium]
MVWFWILTIAMILMGLWFIIPPLISKKSAVSVESDEVNVAIYKQKLSELDNNEENLTDEQIKQAREELEQGLLQDVASKPVTTPAKELNKKTRYQIAALLGILIPVLALLLYAELSPPQWTQLVQYDPTKVAEAKSKLPSIDAMVAKLEEKLQQNPKDPKGWALLGRSYFVMQRYQEAANAYAQANQLAGGKDVDNMVDQAEAMAMASNGNMQGQPEQLVGRALAIKPEHPKSLWLAGTAAFQAGKFQHAIRHWEKLYNMHPDKNNEGAQVLQKQITQAQARLDGKAPAPAAQQTQTASKSKTEVNVTVSLDSKLKARTSPNDTVFIFARAVQGPPMPLAIVKKLVKDLPITIKLNDSMAMMPSMTMSSVPKIYVGARVSKSGNATPQSGDLQGRSAPLTTGKSQKLKLTISQEVL